MPAASLFPMRHDRAPAPSACSLTESSNNDKSHLHPLIDSKKNPSPDAAPPPSPLTRALLSSADRRRGPSTPAPAWKLLDDPFCTAMAAATAARRYRCPPAPAAGSRRTAVSARKLAASLWESQELSLFRDDSEAKETQRKQQQSTQLFTSPDGKLAGTDLSRASSPSSSHVSQRLRRSAPSVRKVLKLLDRSAGFGPEIIRNLDISEIEADGRPNTPSLNKKAPPRKIGQAPVTSGELLKVLNRIWTLEEQHNSSMSMVDALKADLEKARAAVQELTAQQKSYREHIQNLTTELGNEKALLKEREQEAIRVAVLSVKKDLEDERRSKRKLDLLYKKGSKELSDVKKSLEKALRDLEREQKARELMEDVCDELAREIGEDRAQVEELRRESAKVREEVEEERKMLQMAEVWREERVQMKLAEARLQLEEKNAALDKLRNELESFLKAKRAWDARDEGSHTKSAKESGMRRSSLSLPCLETCGDGNVDFTRHPGLASGTEVPDITRSGKDQLVDNCGDVDEDLHSIEFTKESLLAPLKRGQSCYSTVIQLEKNDDENGWLSFDMRTSPVEGAHKAKSGQGNRQGLLRTSSKAESLFAAGENRRKGGKWGDSDWIDCGVEKRERESRERGGERGLYAELKEAVNGPRQSDNNESSLSQGMMGLTGKGQIVQGRGSTSSSRSGGIQGERISLKNEAAADSDLYGNSAAWNFKSQGNSQDFKAMAGSPFAEKTTISRFSPNREWVQYWSSPDPRSPRLTTLLKAPNDLPKVSKDNSLKARLLEAKLEGQQARLRGDHGV